MLIATIGLDEETNELTLQSGDGRVMEHIAQRLASYPEHAVPATAEELLAAREDVTVHPENADWPMFRLPTLRDIAIAKAYGILPVGDAEAAAKTLLNKFGLS